MPKKLTLSEFKVKASEIHKDKFDYSVNDLRTFKYRNKNIKCYGKSNIILNPLM